MRNLSDRRVAVYESDWWVLLLPLHNWEPKSPFWVGVCPLSQVPPTTGHFQDPAEWGRPPWPPVAGDLRLPHRGLPRRGQESER